MVVSGIHVNGPRMTAVRLEGAELIALADFCDTSPRGIAGASRDSSPRGDLAPGDRLPTVRELARDLGVSPATVSHAWQALSPRGLIESRGRAGSFVRPLRTTGCAPRMRGMAAGRRPRAPRPLARHARPAAAARARPGPRRASRRAPRPSSYQAEPVIPALARVLARLLAVAGRVDHGRRRRARRDLAHASTQSCASATGSSSRIPASRRSSTCSSALGAEAVRVALDEDGHAARRARAGARQRPSRCCCSRGRRTPPAPR